MSTNLNIGVVNSQYWSGGEIRVQLFQSGHWQPWRTMKKVEAEKRQFPEKKDFIAEDEIAKLPYLGLGAVIKEALRLYPVLAPWETIQKSCHLDGYEIEPATLVYINEFYPGRFLESGREEIERGRLHSLEHYYHIWIQCKTAISNSKSSNTCYTGTLPMTIYHSHTQLLHVDE